MDANKQKAVEIANKKKKYYGNPQYEMRDENWSVHECYQSAMEAMQWKDEEHTKENQELKHQIRLLVDAIDHAYLRLDGTYGDLSYEVSDQVKYIKSLQTKELEGRMGL